MVAYFWAEAVCTYFQTSNATHSGKRAQNRLKTSLHINKSYFRKVINKQIGLFFENLSDLVVDGFSFLLLANWNTVQNATIQVLLKLLYILYLYCTCTDPGKLAFAHLQCDSVFNGQTRTRQYFCTNYHAIAHTQTNSRFCKILQGSARVCKFLQCTFNAIARSLTI